MKVLLNILTHGDEKIGLKVARELQKVKPHNHSFVVQSANVRAYRLKRRCIDQDLNRSFPGKKNGNYEQRLAYKLSAPIRSADLVLDIHSTKSELKDAIIVTKLNSKTKRCLEAIQPKYVLVMNSSKDHALISQAKIGIAFEYGKDNDPDVLKKIVGDITKLFSYLGLIEAPVSRSKNTTKYFSEFSEVRKPKNYTLLPNIQNYKLVHKGRAFATNGNDYLKAKTSFYPILFGNRNYPDIFGFASTRIYP